VALKVAKRLGPDNAHVFQNGAYVGYTDGRAVKVVALKESITRRIIEVSRNAGAVLELYTPSSLYVERTTEMSERHSSVIGVPALVRDLEDVAATEPVVRAQWVVPLGTEETLAAQTPPGVEVSHAVSPALPDMAFVTLTCEGVSKASAVRQLAAHMRVPLNRVMAVGDSVGDLPMLLEVGYPRIMANATPDLLAQFPNLGHVDECGAVEALQQALALP
jgi:hydroxymethylpyrimidine pyrophosphatase-like HAD family hydrolase